MDMPFSDQRNWSWRGVAVSIKRFAYLKGQPWAVTDVAWRGLAQQIVDGVEERDCLLADCLGALLEDNLTELLQRLEQEILGSP